MLFNCTITCTKQMNDFQQKWCKDLLDQLMAKNISRPFHDDMRNYPFTLISQKENPIQQNSTQTLKFISKKLNDKKYKTPYDFGCDVNKVFEVGFFNFKQNSLIYNSALMLSEWFNKKMQHYPRTEEELWVDSLYDLKKKLAKLIETIPNSTHIAPKQNKLELKHKLKKAKKDSDDLSETD